MRSEVAVRSAGAWVTLAFVLASRSVLLNGQTRVTLQQFYDDAGQLTKVVDSAGNVVEYV
jgi:hypothetical protein